MGYQHLEIDKQDRVAWIWLNRPDKLNAFGTDLWEDVPLAVEDANADDSVRVIVVAGRGAAFTVGIDLGLLAGLASSGAVSPAERSGEIRNTIERFQATNNALANSPKPTIAAVHGYCLGQGMSLITACDIRVATVDTVFSLRETRLGIVADVGALQRLPQIVGMGHASELALSGSDISGERAAEIGLVSHVFPDHRSLIEGAGEIAREIAGNSPLVLSGVKKVLAANRGRTVEQALDYVAGWNAAYLLSADLNEALAAHLEKRPPEFEGR